MGAHATPAPPPPAYLLDQICRNGVTYDLGTNIRKYVSEKEHFNINRKNRRKLGLHTVSVLKEKLLKQLNKNDSS